MTFQESVKTCLSKYATFSGRAQRSEFWWFLLFTSLGAALLSMVDIAVFGTTTTYSGGVSGSTDTTILSGVFSLLVFLPSLSVTVRRLHDLDKSGWWVLLWLIPVIGWIILIVWYATGGVRGENRFGPDPLEV
ncbi:DUF805 domain-containing protein [Phaeovulum sp.]|uniref:DUF805 domain-containing protein n=1 Tax=Phaeovulum sp. TaxID=2934796 RepID=UPI003563CF55